MSLPKTMFGHKVIWFPNEFVDVHLRHLSNCDVTVYWRIGFLTECKRAAVISVAELADYSKCSRRQVLRSIAHLERRGLIRVERSQSRPSRYQIVL